MTQADLKHPLWPAFNEWLEDVSLESSVEAAWHTFLAGAKAAETWRVGAKAAEVWATIDRAVLPGRDEFGCPECGGSGYRVHPENGFNKNSARCSRGCRVRCSICSDPNCDNPGGQH